MKIVFTNELSTEVFDVSFYQVLLQHIMKLQRQENETLDDYYLRMTDFAKKMEWEMCDDCVLSPFSYLKINMFDDLQENEYAVLENKNIKRLLNKPVEENISPVDMDDFFCKQQRSWT